MNIDLDLITACINKERRAEFELYKATYSYLMSICVRYTGNQDDAKEKLNIGFTKILFNLEKYKPEIPFKRWIRRVMINVLINEFHKENKHNKSVEYIENYAENSNDLFINQVLEEMNVEQIHAYIKQLPPVSQKVFNLYVIDGFNHKEIAEMLKMSEGTSKWHLNFSRTKLKEMINKLSSALKVRV